MPAGTGIGNCDTNRQAHRRWLSRTARLDLDKAPGIAETIDWVSALVALGVADLVHPGAVATLTALAKTPDDRTTIRAEYEEFRA